MGAPCALQGAPRSAVAKTGQDIIPSPSRRDELLRFALGETASVPPARHVRSRLSIHGPGSCRADRCFGPVHRFSTANRVQSPGPIERGLHGEKSGENLFPPALEARRAQGFQSAKWRSEDDQSGRSVIVSAFQSSSTFRLLNENYPRVSASSHAP